MQRCFQLAQLAQGNAAPNPMVGAVLVHNDTIIGEGYHARYGGPHAEVACINSVKESNRALISKSVLHVSLEPCAHFGKTPPCADLIIRCGIKKVVVGCRDPFHEVAGRGIQKLEAGGVQVERSPLATEAEAHNKRFFTYHVKRRPYIILKWAQTSNAKIGSGKGPVRISNDHTNRLVHKWRSEEQAIMVGLKTAVLDNPSLTTRLYPGNNPRRIVLDRFLKLPTTHTLFDRTVNTIVLNTSRHEVLEGLTYYKLDETKETVDSILDALHDLDVQSVLVEGGAQLLQSFINRDAWDEVRIITNHQINIDDGVPAPVLKYGELINTMSFQKDSIHIFRNPKQ